MALATPKKLSQATLSTSISILYTVPTGKQCILQEIAITNYTGSDKQVTIYIVPSGQAVGDNFALIKTYTIPAYYLENRGFAIVMDAGATIQAVTTAANSINIYASGSEIS